MSIKCQALKLIRHTASIALLLLLSASGCGSWDSESPPTEAEQLRTQFGAGQHLFSGASLQALLDHEDTTSPITLVQLIAVDDNESFSSYENQVEPIWQRHSGETTFASKIIDQMIGDRVFLEVRVIEFANTIAFIDALQDDAFVNAINTLFASSTNQTWVLGIQNSLPFDPSGGFFDPELQNLDRDAATELLNNVSLEADVESESSIASDDDTIIDMIVSDSPEAFHMVNLIDFYEEAQYFDGRETDLTGEEANAIYGNSITPILLAHNSFPTLIMPVSLVLTAEPIEWEQVAIVRYASRDAFLNAFPLNPMSQQALIHKDAGLENTLVYVTEQQHFEPPEPQSGVMFNLRYCEILMARLRNGSIEAEIYGTPGLNLCPQQAFEALDATAIAAEQGALTTIMNGPRFFVVDWTSNNASLVNTEDTVFFGDIEMRLLTTAQLAFSEISEEATAYQVNEVARSNVWHYVAGRRVYELTDPDGIQFIMQSYTQAVDPNQQLDDLASLDERLELPTGWSFDTRIITNSLAGPTTNGVAQVVTDNLGNTYQLVP